jgi:hypothetical protein
MPTSLEIVVVTRKKIRSKKAMSAMLPAFTLGESFEFLIAE